jgi:hypothetical protein
MSTTISTRGRWAGNPASVRAPRHGARHRLSQRALLGGGVLCGLDLLGLFEREKELIFRPALGASAEAVALQSLDDLAQPLALGTLFQKHRLERARIIGKGRSRRGHETD